MCTYVSIVLTESVPALVKEAYNYHSPPFREKKKNDKTRIKTMDIGNRVTLYTHLAKRKNG